MIRAFIAFSDTLQAPLTILARDEKDVRSMFQAWCERHRPEAQEPDAKFRLLTLTEMALKPKLGDAAGAGVPGLAYWLNHRAGWVVAAPQDNAKGALAPPEIDVRCFSVNDDDGEHLVFAENIEIATAFYAHRSMIDYGVVDDKFSVQEMSRWLLCGPMVTLREDMDAGLLGIGSVSTDEFWNIYPVDYEPTFER